MPEIEVRPLEAGSEARWLELEPPPEDPAERLREFVEHFAEKGRQDPRCFLVAFDEDRVVGTLEGLFFDPEVYFIRKVSVAEDAARPSVEMAFGKYLAPSFAEDSVLVLAWDRPDAAAINRLLTVSDFVIEKRKAFVRKDLTEYRLPYEDPFSYRSLAEVGEEGFLEIMTAAAHGDPFENVEGRDPKEDFDELVKYAGSKFDDTWWSIAYLDDRPVGVVLPQEFSDADGEGTLFYVGVLPEFRGKHFGRILHARGLAFLRSHGVLKYAGSTDTRNLPMMRVFEVNGCERTGTQLFYKPLSKRGAGEKTGTEA
jgi:RimJ/RimL family protein N-acetyltransferase